MVYIEVLNTRTYELIFLVLLLQIQLLLLHRHLVVGFPLSLCAFQCIFLLKNPHIP